MAIPFNQFMLPYGHKKQVEIDRSPGIEEKAQQLISAGFEFNIEILRTGEVSMTCERDGELICIEITNNDPSIPLAVDQLIIRAWDYWISERN